MDIIIVPILGIFLTTSLQCVEANLSLDFKVTKISASPANCNVANTTYAHGETFKLDCKTQCVCENGRHACSSLCPKEQLPAPEDTISCRSPRLVEVPGHCCKMWLCENPTADVYATCHNSSTSPWTPCSQPCGLGISTRFTATTAGCNQLINLRLCDNRKCQTTTHWDDRDDLMLKTTHYLSNGMDAVEERLNHKYDSHLHRHHDHHKQRLKKSHECRHLERLGPARIRLGQCVSRKLYRPKVCGHCHQSSKCCMPSVSTTIQVELLCPLNAADPISIVQQQEEQQQPQEFYGASSLTSLWDTHSLDGIDQEYFQSHQIHIENKFIAIEWILKCECSENDDCGRSVNVPHRRGSNDNNNGISNENSDDDVYDNNNNGGHFNIDNNSNNKKSHINQQDGKDNNGDDDYDYFGLYGKVNKNNYKHRHLQHIDDNSADHDDDGGGHASGDTILARSGHNGQTERHSAGRAPNDGDEAAESPSSFSANSDEIQPDIIPYPPPPFTTNDRSTNIISSSIRKHNGKVNSNRSSKNNNNSHKSTGQLSQTAGGIDEDLLIERQQEKAQQEKYFYQQWLLQQQQQKSQQSLLEQLLGT